MNNERTARNLTTFWHRLSHSETAIELLFLCVCVCVCVSHVYSISHSFCRFAHFDCIKYLTKFLRAKPFYGKTTDFCGYANDNRMTLMILMIKPLSAIRTKPEQEKNHHRHHERCNSMPNLAYPGYK